MSRVGCAGCPRKGACGAALAERWASLVHEFMSGNLGIVKSVATMYQGEPAMRQQTGLE